MQEICGPFSFVFAALHCQFNDKAVLWNQTENLHDQNQYINTSSFKQNLHFYAWERQKDHWAFFFNFLITHTHMHQVWKKSPKMNWGKGTRKCTREPHKKNLPIGLKDFFKESLIDAWEVLLKFLTLQLGCYGNVVTCCFKHFCLQKYQQEHYWINQPSPSCTSWFLQVKFNTENCCCSSQLIWKDIKTEMADHKSTTLYHILGCSY